MADAVLQAGRWLAEEWLPQRCALCTRRDAPASRVAAGALCADCDAALPGRHASRCLRCALPVGAAGGRIVLCERCARTRHDDGESLDAMMAAMDYAPPVDRLILSMKRNRPGLAAPLGALLADTAAVALRADAAADAPRAADEAGRSAGALAAWLDGLQPDLVVPVPLSCAKLAERGFDQALELARPVARRLCVPLAARGLERLRDAPAQKTLDAAARLYNLHDVFGADARAVAGRRIALVDDVSTTGTTLREAATALKAAGAVAVVGLAVARVR